MQSPATDENVHRSRLPSPSVFSLPQTHTHLGRGQLEAQPGGAAPQKGREHRTPGQ